jgi:P4 family phage/plasmid primase-like protien
MEDEKRGLDDFVVGGGSVEEIIAACRPADEMLKEWAAAASATSDHAFTQWGAALRLNESLGGEFVWCPKVKWHAWDEEAGVWVRPADHILLQRSVVSLAEQIAEEVKGLKNLGSDEDAGRAYKFLLDMQNVGQVRGANKFMEPLMVGSWESFDQNPDRLTVANGTLVFDGADVRLEDHAREDFITKRSPVTYDPAATCPFWLSTLEAFVPNERIRSFLQRLAGSLLAAVGVKEQKIPFCYGEGGCGKSTFAQGMTTILGEDLAVPVDPATIRNAQRSGSSASPDLFALLGARVVIAEEAEDPDGGKSTGIDVGMIKRWSGGTSSTKIVARPMYGDVVKFMPTFTLVLVANNAPDFKDRTDGIWRRLLVIPFNTPMPSDRKMEATEVARRFEAEASGMLNWALEGYREWRRQGLNPPEEVLLAGSELRASQDWLGNFLRECVHADPEGFVTSEEMHEAFLDWRGHDKEIPDKSRRALEQELAKKWGATKQKRVKVEGEQKTKARRGWQGWSLGASEDSETVTEVRGVTDLEKTSVTGITAGQSPFTPPKTPLSQKFSQECFSESVVSSYPQGGFHENFCDTPQKGLSPAETLSQKSESTSVTAPLSTDTPTSYVFPGGEGYERLYRRRGEG